MTGAEVAYPAHRSRISDCPEYPTRPSSQGDIRMSMEALVVLFTVVALVLVYLVLKGRR